jgi:hypothetical protein
VLITSRFAVIEEITAKFKNDCDKSNGYFNFIIFIVSKNATNNNIANGNN